MYYVVCEIPKSDYLSALFIYRFKYCPRHDDLGTLRSSQVVEFTRASNNSHAGWRLSVIVDFLILLIIRFQFVTEVVAETKKLKPIETT